ncbi:mannosyltransferase putative-domain-containing protein [Phycomyces blakesleeanus]
MAVLLLSTVLFQFGTQIQSLVTSEAQDNIPWRDDAAIEESRLEDERKARDEAEKKAREEDERLKWISNHLSVREPVLTEADANIATHDYAVPIPVSSWTKDDTKQYTSVFGQLFLADLFTKPEKLPDFKLLTVQQRVFKALFQYFDPIITAGQDFRSDPAWELYERLENSLYPWLKPNWSNAFHINNNTQGRGIVMCIGNDQFKYAVPTLKGIRHGLNSTLPIQVYYIRDDDLSETRRRYLLSEFTDLTIHKAVDSFNDRYTRFGGWSVKSYAMLASSFSEVILMDADVYFFKNPELLFNDPGYKTTGSLFYYDRTLFPGWDDGRKWLESFLPTVSSHALNTRWWTARSAHEQESGVVIMDKRKCLLGLLSTCKMNDKRERDEVTYKHVHGDKETFWIGYEMVQTPYAFVKSYGAVIGGLGDGGNSANVCGNQLHLDIDGDPLWWNGGLLRDKNKWDNRYMMVTHFAEGEDWEFDTSCIKETDKIRTFSNKDKDLGKLYQKYDAQRKKEEKSIEEDTWIPTKSK